MKYWQDLAKTIEATKDGDPVAVIAGTCVINGQFCDLIQEDPAKRPTLEGGAVVMNGSWKAVEADPYYIIDNNQD